MIRPTGRDLTAFGEYVLLTNFSQYVTLFARRFGVEVVGEGLPIQSATAENLSILNFGMGSAMAATVMDLLSAVQPKAVLFLGKCGGLKKTKIGDFILPIAAIRGEGTSNEYFPPDIPALPSFRLRAAGQLSRRRSHPGCRAPHAPARPMSSAIAHTTWDRGGPMAAPRRAA